MEYKKIIHGSENSLDIDAYIIVDKTYENQQAKELCLKFEELNTNLVKIDNGIVTWCYKGTTDECNNSILGTFHLHKQSIDNPIEHRLERNYGLKMLRTIRGLLSYCSRTEFREDVKKSLRSGDLNIKLSMLKRIDLNLIEDFDKNSKIEAYKFFAFQLGQTLALLENDIELFTKNSVAQYYPELKLYLDREQTSSENLAVFWTGFVNFLEKNCVKVDKHEWFYVNFHGKKQVLNCKQEIVLPPVVVFDVDGTLMDEKHRSEFRDQKRWDEYFSRCDLDTPIKKSIDLCNNYKDKGYEVWIMTGRSELYQDKTVKSLVDAGVRFDHIKMRGKDVLIPDYVLKPAWIAKYIGTQRVEAIYDDNSDVLDGFIKKGLNAIDIATISEFNYRNVKNNIK